MKLLASFAILVVAATIFPTSNAAIVVRKIFKIFV